MLGPSLFFSDFKCKVSQSTSNQLSFHILNLLFQHVYVTGKVNTWKNGCVVKRISHFFSLLFAKIRWSTTSLQRLLKYWVENQFLECWDKYRTRKNLANCKLNIVINHIQQPQVWESSFSSWFNFKLFSCSRVFLLQSIKR